MSNHDGGHLLNDALNLMSEYGLLQNLKTVDRYAFLKRLVNLAVDDYDCNAGEILDNFTEEFNICYCCLEATPNFSEMEGVCIKCYHE